MSIRKYLDWRGYLEGFYLTWIKTVTTTLLTVLGTNAVEKLGIQGMGLSLKQAGAMLGTITVVEILKYLQAKPKPDTITENVETSIIKKEDI